MVDGCARGPLSEARPGARTVARRCCVCVDSVDTLALARMFGSRRGSDCVNRACGRRSLPRIGSEPRRGIARVARSSFAGGIRSLRLTASGTPRAELTACHSLSFLALSWWVGLARGRRCRAFRGPPTRCRWPSPPLRPLQTDRVSFRAFSLTLLIGRGSLLRTHSADRKGAKADPVWASSSASTPRSTEGTRFRPLDDSRSTQISQSQFHPHRRWKIGSVSSGTCNVRQPMAVLYSRLRPSPPTGLKEPSVCCWAMTCARMRGHCSRRRRASFCW